MKIKVLVEQLRHRRQQIELVEDTTDREKLLKKHQTRLVKTLRNAQQFNRPTHCDTDFCRYFEDDICVDDDCRSRVSAVRNSTNRLFTEGGQDRAHGDAVPCDYLGNV